MTAASPLVLRGRDGAVLRFTGAAVTLGRADGEHYIPLAAIESVYAEGRSVEVELISRAEAEPVVYRVEDVSEAAATAFVRAVDAALPDEVADVDGSTLVTHRPPVPPARRRYRGAVVLAGIAAPVIALDVFLGVVGRAEHAIAFWLPLVVTAIGGFLVWGMGRDLYRMWYLPRHGITVAAEFSHFTNKSRVYLYRDTTGATHRYTTTTAGPVEVSYHPRDPSVAIHLEGSYVRCMMAFMTLVGCGMAGGGVFWGGALVVSALQG
ncbi:DUF3592 domain-containing protein [Streptomyces bikiniensis]|uniref:hypothetical protein n=1 Tax=Streptomyces bikiniensis TaxID=1896 RepID=UPI00068C455F|nr:hypothetical protein [Streptomyces bikiniensis]